MNILIKIKSRINDEADYLKKLFRKLENTDLSGKNTDDEKSKRTPHQREIHDHFAETIHYLETRDEFWEYMN